MMLDKVLECFNDIIDQSYIGTGNAPFFKCHHHVMKTSKLGSFRECHLYIIYNVPLSDNSLQSWTVAHICHKAAVDANNIDSLVAETEKTALLHFIRMWDEHRLSIINGEFAGVSIDEND